MPPRTLIFGRSPTARRFSVLEFSESLAACWIISQRCGSAISARFGYNRWTFFFQCSTLYTPRISFFSSSSMYQFDVMSFTFETRRVGCATRSNIDQLLFRLQAFRLQAFPSTGFSVYRAPVYRAQSVWTALKRNARCEIWTVTRDFCQSFTTIFISSVDLLFSVFHFLAFHFNPLSCFIGNSFSKKGGMKAWDERLSYIFFFLS